MKTLRFIFLSGLAISVLGACAPVKFSGTDLASGVAQEEPTPDNPSKPPPGPNSPSPIPPSKRQRYILQCEQAKAKAAGFTPLPNNSSLSYLAGAGLFLANQLASLYRIAGAAVVVGSNPDARIGKITDAAGAIVICDMDVGSIEFGAGAVAVVRGNVDQVSFFAGALVVIDGKIGNVSFSAGLIEEL